MQLVREGRQDIRNDGQRLASGELEAGEQRAAGRVDSEDATLIESVIDRPRLRRRVGCL